MSTKYIASNWRLPNQENSSKSDNYGLTFDGTEYIEGTSEADTLNNLTALSVSMWLNQTDVASFKYYLSIGNNGGSPTDFLELYSHGTASRSFNVEGSIATAGFQSFDFSSFVSNTTWFHLALVWDSTQSTATDRIKIYIDGVLRGSLSGVTSTFDTNGEIKIGRTWRNTSNTFDGSISEVAVFDYALSESQISTLYGSSSLGAGNPMALPTPVAYYPLGDNSASNPLTQPNEAVEDASVFDFSSDYIDCGIPSFLNSTSVFTSSLWFNTNDVGTQTTLWAVGSSASQLWVISKYEDDLIIYGGTGTKYYRKNNLFSINTWYNLIVVYDGSQSNADRFKVYLNGDLLTGATINGTIETITPTFTTNLNIGRIGYAAASYFNGEISNVVFWNSDQTTEISNIYNSGVPATSYTNTPTAWYKLDQSANWEADSSGNWQIPDAVSAYPQSFDFDNSANSHIKLGSSLGNSLGDSYSGDLTLSMWFNADTSIINKGLFQIGTTTSQGVFSVRGVSGTAISFGLNQIAYTSKFNFSDLNNWHHLVCVYKGGAGGTTKMYLDGVPQSTTDSGAFPTSLDFDTEEAYIGLIYNLTGYDWDGKISNVQFWNTEIPATGTDSVETLYNNGTPLTTAIASDNLKAWYKLDNTATFSTNWSVPDASGNGNTGTSAGMTQQNLVNNNVSALNGESSGMTSANLVLSDLTRAVPYDSYSFNFDSASSDSVNLPNGLETILQSLTVGSISMWWNPVDATPSSGNALFTVASTTVTNDYFAMYNITDGKFYAQLKDNNSNNWILQTDAAAFSDNTWHHIVITQNGTEPELYVNGSKPAQTFTTSTNKTKWWDDITIEQVNIGALIWSGGTSGNIDGKISNCAIFNQALTSTEVMKLYANGVPQDLTSFTPAPVAWYPLGSNSFWNGSQWTVRDMIGSNDGTGQNIGVDGLVGDAPRSEANGTGTNMDVPSNLEGSTKWSENNSWSINMSETARVEDTP